MGFSVSGSNQRNDPEADDGQRQPGCPQRGAALPNCRRHQPFHAVWHQAIEHTFEDERDAEPNNEVVHPSPSERLITAFLSPVRSFEKDLG